MNTTNTKKLTSHVVKSTVFGWSVIGCLLMILLGAAMMLSGNFDLTDGFVVCLPLLIAFLVIGLIIGFIRSGNLKSKIAKQEIGAAVPFDSDTFHSITRENNLYLGDHWVLGAEGNKIIPIAKEHFKGASNNSGRKEGMKRLWVFLNDDKGNAYPYMYTNAGTDVEELLNQWKNPVTPEPEPSQQEAPQKEVQEEAPAVWDGTCPHCLGPNDPEAEVCQWCGEKLEKPAPVVQAAVSDAAPKEMPAAAPVSIGDGKPMAQTSIPEPETSSSTGTYIVIAVLTIILLVLLARIYL